jgi:hypothetical protein
VVLPTPPRRLETAIIFVTEGSPKLRDPIAALFAIGVCCT